jgi:hypothetical protein
MIDTTTTHDCHIINTYIQKRDYMLSQHSKVLQKRFDLHYPQDNSIIPHPDHISNFTENLTRRLQRQNSLPQQDKKISPRRDPFKPITHPHDAQILCVREQSSENNHPHYHCIALVNGHARQDGYYIQQQAQRAWNTTLGYPKNSNNNGLVDNCYNSNGPDYHVMNKNHRDFNLQVEQSYNQATYLAKTRTKELNPKGSWRVTGTRIPKQK